MEAEKIIELLISEGKLSQEELDHMIKEEREKSPLLPIHEDVDILKLTADMSMVAIADAYENQIISDINRQAESEISMFATAELYETIMMMQMEIDALKKGEN